MWVLLTLACIACGDHFIVADGDDGKPKQFASQADCLATMHHLVDAMSIDVAACRNTKTGESFFTARQFTGS